MRPATLRLLVLLFAALGLAACIPVTDPGTKGEPLAPGSTPVSVSITNFAFSQPSLTIAAGSTVTWTNNASFTQHTATRTSGSTSFNSGNLAPGTTFSETFPTAGTWTYRCNIHTSMTGTITVTN